MSKKCRILLQNVQERSLPAMQGGTPKGKTRNDSRYRAVSGEVWIRNSRGDMSGAQGSEILSVLSTVLTSCVC